MTSKDDYRITSDPDLIGKVYRVTDALDRETEYTFDADTGATTQVTYPDSSTETYTYYLDSQSQKTHYPRSVKNVKGDWTHYVRSASTLHRVDAVKVAAGPSEPADWSAVSPIKEYLYYPDTDAHGQDGRLWKEIVQDIDGSVDNEKVYEYWEIVNSVEKLRASPTKVYYQYWDDGTSGYIQKYDQSVYDDMGRVTQSTDANGRSVYYEYDAQGRQTKTIFKLSPEVSTESSYGCCTLEGGEGGENR